MLKRIAHTSRLLRRALFRRFFAKSCSFRLIFAREQRDLHYFPEAFHRPVCGRRGWHSLGMDSFLSGTGGAASNSYEYEYAKTGQFLQALSVQIVLKIFETLFKRDTLQPKSLFIAQYCARSRRRPT